MESLVEIAPPVRPLGLLPVAGNRAIQRIGLMLFDGCSLLTAGIIAEAFRVANELELQRNRRPVYQLSLLSYRGGNVACSSSVRVWTQGLDALGQRGFNAIFIACSEREPVGERDARLMSALMEVSASVLERCGRSRDMPTPRVSRALAQRPGPIEGLAEAVQAPASVFWCRGGTDSAPDVMPSAIDMALAQIESDLGNTVAREVARLLDPPRNPPYDAARAQIEAVLSDEQDHEPEGNDDRACATAAKIRASARWMTEHYMEEISVADAARVAAMSERNYLRRFKYMLGMTPSEYLLRARLEMSCRLLMKTSLPVDKIARRCGMGNGDRLGKIFRKRYSLSPTEYRNKGRAGPFQTTPLLEET